MILASLESSPLSHLLPPRIIIELYFLRATSLAVVTMDPAFADALAQGIA